MYADDTSISLHGSSTSEIEMNMELNNIDQWLRTNKLSLNTTKTEMMIIGSRQKLAAQDKASLEVKLGETKLKQVDHTKSLGVTIDTNLSWAEHISNMTKKISSKLSAFKRIRPFITKESAVKIYNALVRPDFDYCSEVWGGTFKTLCDRLQKLQNRAARIVTRSNYDIRQPVGSVGGAPDYCAGDRGSIPGRTNTQGLKITEEGAAFVITSANG